MKKLILVKLGGSIITNKNIAYKANLSVLRRLARELKSAKFNLVLSHGSGSFGHTSASKYGGKKGYKNIKGIARVSRDAMEINRIVIDTLIDEGLPVVSFRPNSLMTSDSGKLKNSFFESAEIALNQNIIPVFYGDVIWDTKWKSTIFSGEKILETFSTHLTEKGFKIKKIIQVVNTNGVYEASKKTIPLITKNSWNKYKDFITTSDSTDVTGGMKHKVENALVAASLGTQTLIINGNKNNELKNALLGKKTGGTIIK